MLELALAVAVLSGPIIESFVEPRSKADLGFQRLAISGCIAGVLMMVIFIVSARPVFATAVAIVLMVSIAVVSNAKFGVLREPLVFIDFAMLEEAAAHPGLFLPHVKIIPALSIILSILLGIWTAIVLETPVKILPGQWPGQQLAAIAGLLALVFIGYRLARSRLIGWGWRLRPSLDPRTDIGRFGLFGSLLLSVLLFADQRGKEVVRQKNRRKLDRALPRKLPDIVAVQAESFFDARRMDRRIDRRLLRSWDACGESALFRGRLHVPTWGAATQRTEFAFLTRLPEDALGLDRFNPYLRFAKQPVWSIAHELRELGYRTICVHPFFGTFFGRDRVLPNLGFDEFLDIASFQGARPFGPHIADAWIGEKIAALLEETEQPKFIFAITMENHGPWTKDRLPPVEIARARALAPGLPPEFLCYLRHLENTDAMIGRVASEIQRNKRDGVLCVFGDHVPGFSKLFEQANYSDPCSDYLIWRPDHDGKPLTRDASILELSDMLLSVAGIGPELPPEADPRPKMEDVRRPPPSTQPSSALP